MARSIKESMVAIVPARSGSKGLPNKNVLPICGHPMLWYTLKAAKESSSFDEVVLSTDSRDYGLIGFELGCQVIYRDEKLSSDQASSYDVIKHALENISLTPDAICLLQPTSPLRSATHISNAVMEFRNLQAEYDFLVSVSESSHPGVLIGNIGPNGDLSYLEKRLRGFHRQDHNDYYPNGAIFIGKTKEYLDRGDFFGKKSKAYIMSKWSSVDVDDYFDYVVASLLMEREAYFDAV